MSRPHLALMNIMLEVYPLSEAGECSGEVVKINELSEFNLKPSILVSILGKNKEDCLNKLKQKIEELTKNE